MLNAADIRHRQLLLLYAEQLRHLCISQGNIVIKDADGGILTKLSRHQVLALLIIGQCTLTSVLIDFCQKHSIALVLLNSRLRPILFAFQAAEANFLVRQYQYEMSESDRLALARRLIYAKIGSELVLLKSIRQKSDELHQAIGKLENYQCDSLAADALDQLMGIEGNAARLYFKQFFGQLKSQTWSSRKPRLKLDPINVVLDMGYTLLFNYIECNLQLFGFDVYRGMLHQLWFRRKSLVCDLVEPFRVIIDRQVVKSFNLGQFKSEHFTQHKHQYQLQTKHNKEYYAILMAAIIEHKQEIFIFIQQFYRALMRFASAGGELQLFTFDPFDKSEHNEPVQE